MNMRQNYSLGVYIYGTMKERLTYLPTDMVPTLSEDVARDALLEFVGKKWMYSSKPDKNLTFKELKPFTVYLINLVIIHL